MSERPNIITSHGYDVVDVEKWTWGKKYAERTYLAGKPEDDACIHCGRPTSKKHAALGILISDGGNTAVRPADYDTYPHNGGDMGWFPVGRECIKQIPSAYYAQDPYGPRTN